MKISIMSGLVRRRDLHNALVEGRAKTPLVKWHRGNFCSENATADKALRLLLNEHSQLSVVVDEYGSVADVLALEDVMESILGQEIFEHDDIAADKENLQNDATNKQVNKITKT